jgi:acetylornithine deacetylase/succinyl-diaminopimelate desuccinylase-like protein
MRNDAIKFAQQNYQKTISFFNEIISIPSISTLPENSVDLQLCANLLMGKFKELGFEHIHLFPTQKHPIIYADLLHAGPDKPTILIYGHYDVQPVDPIDLWTSEPFKSRIDGDYLYSRGSSDMKGQIVACLAAIEAIIKTGQFPVNIKYIVEGEEEIGSPNLKPFLESHKDLLKSDVALNPDCGMVGINTPTIVYGLRGLAYFEIRVFGPDHDLHSGVFGGVVHNPAQVLIDLISKMHDTNGKITLPNFYDDVLKLSTNEKAELNRLNMDDSYYKSQTGVLNTWGEKGYSPVERIGARPTLEVNGFLAGFTGNGAKTVIPATVSYTHLTLPTN